MFEDIASFNDTDFWRFQKEVKDHPEFLAGIKYFFPEKSDDQIAQWLNSISSNEDVRKKIALYIIDRVLKVSSKGLSINAIENIPLNTKNTYVSNHRDICMDSCLINKVLDKRGLPTCQSGMGDNLFTIPWVSTLLRVIGGFLVKRNLPPKESLTASKELSEYIKHTLEVRKESIWIAQKEGRAKDGIDKTNPAIIKMILMANNSNSNVAELKKRNIIPLSFSYEKEPCQKYKLREIYHKRTTGTYVKEEGEDVKNMLEGITGEKGKIVVSIGKSINQELDALPPIKNKNEFARAVTDIIDNAIYASYFLHPVNYIAYDLLYKSTKFSENYSTQAVKNFKEEILVSIKSYPDKDLAEKIILELYANPVNNKLKQGNSK